MKFNNMRIFCVSLLLCSGLAASNGENLDIETVVEGLEHPWGVTFISENEMLVTELSGNIRRVSNGLLSPEPIGGVPEVLYAGLNTGYRSPSRTYLETILKHFVSKLFQDMFPQPGNFFPNNI